MNLTRATFTRPFSSISVYLLLRHWTAEQLHGRVTRRLLHPVDTSHYGSASWRDAGHVPLMYGVAVTRTFAFARVLASFNLVLVVDDEARLARIILRTNEVITQRLLARLDTGVPISVQAVI